MRRFIAGLTLVAAVMAAAYMQAAGTVYPARTVRIIVAFSPGGPADFVARLLAERLKDLLGQTFIVENRAGANGAIGAAYTARAAPDGYTLFLTTVGAVAVTPHLTRQTDYDVIKDFEPISRVVRNTTILVVRPDLPVESARDLAAMARARPGTIAIASSGVGSMPHLALELYQSAADVHFIHVPYRGAAPALSDLLAGNVQGMFADVPVLLPLIQAHKLKPIGAAADYRSEILPDVPTLAEQGFQNTSAENWYGLLAPAHTPAPIISKLRDAVAAAFNDPETLTRLKQSGAIPAVTSSEEFGQLLKSELSRWGQVVREKNIAPIQ